MRDFTVRPARIEDHGRLTQVYRDASLSNPGDRAALLAHPDALILDESLISRGRVRVATLADGQVIGFASTSPTDSGSLELDDLFVDPPWQRRGVGLALLKALEVEARRDGIVRLEVTANDHAFEFYRSAGFETDDRVETELGAGSRMHLEISPMA